jgi:hypothetical protein
MSRLHREREDETLSLRFGPPHQIPGYPSKEGWYWGIHFKSFEILRGEVSKEECNGMEEIAALVQERATFLKRCMATEVPGWDLRWGHESVEGWRSADGLLLNFLSNQRAPESLGWEWVWRIFEGASRTVLARGGLRSEAQLDLLSVASYVSDRAAEVVFSQGFYR